MISKLTNPDVIQFIQQNLHRDPTKVALEAEKYPSLPIREIASQIASRKKVEKKIPEWTENTFLIFPPKENLEQASSEQTALYKASLIVGKSFVDLTGGTGIDCYYMSQRFDTRVFVEPNANLCELAAHNFGILKADIEVNHTTAEQYLESTSQHFDIIYLDPSRRTGTKERVFKLEEYQPNVLELLPNLLERGRKVIIKASPMLDIKQAIRSLNNVTRVHCVAVNNELKELFFELSKDESGSSPVIVAVNLIGSKKTSYTGTFEREQNANFTIGPVVSYLYEPNVALRKAGFFKLIAQEFDLRKIHTNTHIYSSKSLIEEFQGRVFELEEKLSLDKKSAKRSIKNIKANTLSKNYPLSVVEIKKKYGISDGGETYLIFCKSETDGNVCLKCNRIK